MSAFIYLFTYCWFFCRMLWLKLPWKNLPHCTAPSTHMAQELQQSVSLGFSTVQRPHAEKGGKRFPEPFLFWSFKAYGFCLTVNFFVKFVISFLFRKKRERNIHLNPQKHLLSVNIYWAPTMCTREERKDGEQARGKEKGKEGDQHCLQRTHSREAGKMSIAM